MTDDTIELVLELDDDESPDALARRVAHKTRRPLESLPELTILRRSIDARHGRVVLRLLLGIGTRLSRPEEGVLPRPVAAGKRVIIVGCGPAGLFCAYELARKGIASVVLDRGKQVQPRRHDLKALNRRGRVDSDSNYCFGEGGAGTYSDGKLYTRAHKRGDVRDVLEILALHGAPERILTDARPHIGSNRLPVVIQTLRERLVEVGVEFRFGARVVGLHRDGGARGVVLADGSEIEGDAVVMATGHSARDIFELLRREDILLEPKGFALGVRIEHPQPMINAMQYGRAAGHAKLPAAAYKLVQQVDGRGVFSFCMCPGGWIVPAATEEGMLVVNGMSLSRRDSPFANSGLVVSLEPSDWQAAGFSGPLGGVELQKAIESAAWRAGGGALQAPAVRVTDFLRGRVSTDLPKTSYLPGIAAADLAAVVDAAGLPLAQALRSALHAFDRKMRGYVSEEAILVGVESRSSAPVRVPRDQDSLQSPSLEGLYPCGEGAGHAGGIVSAAMDGMRVARAIASAR